MEKENTVSEMEVNEEFNSDKITVDFPADYKKYGFEKAWTELVSYWPIELIEVSIQTFEKHGVSERVKYAWFMYQTLIEQREKLLALKVVQ
ncbi:hypothetical protein LSG31_00340 [Fodinisporobacter ferrooxydans]|uniref:Uncharacterized protein n=1 Tax=Fodinisporobacter ferrooxydans TaxID=2901836 RepID=A0ABY4CMM2_9BACL|nr:hypothetical protein LSG31_00340 [Alicyclobacillaceae bacterium MYW30-H2]